jgi:CelD/BcsL family acetyltransferase involved in cellulose biosynthesis
MAGAPASALPGTPSRPESNACVVSDLGEVAEEWDALARALETHPFARPGWIRAWVEAFADPQALVFAVARDGGNLVALIPFSAARGVLRTPANWHTPEVAVLGEPDALRLALSAALATGPRRIALRVVPDETANVLRPALAAAGYRIVERTLQVSPFVRLDRVFRGSPQSSPVLPGDLGRKWRRLVDVGRLEVDERDGRADLAPMLEEGFRVEGSGWKNAAGTAIVSHESTRRFYYRIAAWGASEGLLSLAYLRLDGRAIAFQFGFRTKREYYFLKGGYDPEFARYSPGKLLHARMLERMHADGVERYEFLGDIESYKLTWPYESKRFLEIVAYRTSPAGTVDRLLTGHLPAALRRARSFALHARAGVPKRIFRWRR